MLVDHQVSPQDTGSGNGGRGGGDKRVPYLEKISLISIMPTCLMHMLPSRNIKGSVTTPTHFTTQVMSRVVPLLDSGNTSGN